MSRRLHAFTRFFWPDETRASAEDEANEYEDAECARLTFAVPSFPVALRLTIFTYSASSPEHPPDYQAWITLWSSECENNPVRSMICDGKDFERLSLFFAACARLLKAVPQMDGAS